MHSRRNWLKALVGLSVIGLPLHVANGQNGRVVSLETQLKLGLRTTRQSQRAFIDQVLVKVQAGELPQGLVNLVYKWALERYPRVPFPYFQFALRELARRRGVSL